MGPFWLRRCVPMLRWSRGGVRERGRADGGTPDTVGKRVCGRLLERKKAKGGRRGNERRGEAGGRGGANCEGGGHTARTAGGEPRDVRDGRRRRRV